MPAGRSDGERAPHVLLPADLREVEFALLGGGGERLVRVDADGLGVGLTRDQAHGFRKGRHAVDRDLGDDRRLGGVLYRDYHRLVARPARGKRGRQRPRHGPHSTVERELAHRHELARAAGVDLLGSYKKAERYRQVVGGPFLPDVGGREVYRDAAVGEAVAGVRERRLHAVARLLHRGVREPDCNDRRKPARHVDLDLDGHGLDSDGRGACDAGEGHRSSSPLGVTEPY